MSDYHDWINQASSDAVLAIEKVTGNVALEPEEFQRKARLVAEAIRKHVRPVIEDAVHGLSLPEDSDDEVIAIRVRILESIAKGLPQ